jgi:hypothetical protein
MKKNQPTQYTWQDAVQWARPVALVHLAPPLGHPDNEYHKVSYPIGSLVQGGPQMMTVVGAVKYPDGAMAWDVTLCRVLPGEGQPQLEQEAVIYSDRRGVHVQGLIDPARFIEAMSRTMLQLPQHLIPPTMSEEDLIVMFGLTGEEGQADAH